MAEQERFRDPIETPPDDDYWNRRLDQGWRPVAVEWLRPVETLDSVDESSRDSAGPLGLQQEVPYGLQVSSDCRHLVENPREIEALTVILEGIVADRKLSEVAAELDRRQLPPRHEARWTQVSVFEMLPRLIEVAPKILSSQQWSERREKVLRLVS